MKKLLLVVLAFLMLCGCAKTVAEPKGYSFTDDLQRQVNVDSSNRVIALYGSYAQCWTLAGGSLVGATQDAISERKMELADAVICGSVKQPDLESIISLEPDFVILSADISAQSDMDKALDDAGITHAYFRVDTYHDYAKIMRVFCDMTGRDDLYKENAATVVDSIEEILAQPRQTAPTVLLLRAFSTGVKAKTDDILAGAILRDLGAQNITDVQNSLLEDLSLEQIINQDPEFIFVVTMGEDEQKALDNLQNTLCASPAWSELSAVKNNRFIVLPKELFHYKPNTRWAESYEYLEKILFQ